MSECILSVTDLKCTFKTNDGLVDAVHGVSFDVFEGEVLGFVGESGAGKSQVFMSIMGILASNGKSSGSVKFKGQEILNLPLQEFNKIRGRYLSMIFQDPMTSLNPYLTLSKQMSEVLVYHKGLSWSDAEKKSLEMLDCVKIPEAKMRLKMYPHELSGGMRQRVMIAMSLLCEPDILIADEPTTALDVTVQAQILDLMLELKKDFGTAIIMITHDLGVVAQICDRVHVMYGGRIIEKGDVNQIFYHPFHPYTKGLLNSTPRMDENVQDALIAIPGNPPSLGQMSKGCSFQDRCDFCMPKCLDLRPELVSTNEGGFAACHLV
jgi:oligopeptide transport system ATP-binding protein